MDMVLEVLLSGTQFRKLLEQRYAFLEREHGLRRIDVQILCRLYAARERNTAKDIAGLGLFTKGHVSQSLHRLQQMGYITAATDDADHRCAHLRLTPAALALAERASAEQEEIGRALLAGITPEERLALLTIAGKLYQNMQRELNGPCGGEEAAVRRAP